MSIDFPMSCLDEDTSCEDSLAGMGSAVGGVAVSVQNGDVCETDYMEPLHTGTAARTITIDGSIFTDSVGRDTEFCQQGNGLRIRQIDDNPFGATFTLIRK